MRIIQTHLCTHIIVGSALVLMASPTTCAWCGGLFGTVDRLTFSGPSSHWMPPAKPVFHARCPHYLPASPNGWTQIQMQNPLKLKQPNSPTQHKRSLYSFYARALCMLNSPIVSQLRWSSGRRSLANPLRNFSVNSWSFTAACYSRSLFGLLGDL